MKVKTPQIGGVAQSVRGRDAGRYYVISEVLEGKVALVDGKVKTLARPKIKNLKHVRLLPCGVSFKRDGAYDVNVAHYLKIFKPENQTEDASFV